MPRGKVSTAELTALLGDASRLVDPDRFLLGTFGLLSPGKGLEQAIDAVGLLVESHPAVSLIIAGQTHPEIRDRNGETYRESLVQRCAERGVAAHVTFVDGYLSVDEIAAILARTDAFCTPYREMDQVVSGVLTFAMAAGCAVISTPYRYALDMLGDGAGTLVPVDDPPAMAAAIARFIDEPLRLLAAQRAASQFRALLSWPSVGALLLGAIRQMYRPSFASIGAPA